MASPLPTLPIEASSDTIASRVARVRVGAGMVDAAGRTHQNTADELHTSAPGARGLAPEPGSSKSFYSPVQLNTLQPRGSIKPTSGNALRQLSAYLLNAEGTGGEARAAPQIDAGIPSLPILKVVAPPVVASAAAAEVATGGKNAIDAVPQLLTFEAQLDTSVIAAAGVSAAPAESAVNELASDSWEE